MIYTCINREYWENHKDVREKEQEINSSKSNEYSNDKN